MAISQYGTNGPVPVGRQVAVAGADDFLTPGAGLKIDYPQSGELTVESVDAGPVGVDIRDDRPAH